MFCNFFENDEIKLKELKLKKKRKQIELQNAINKKKLLIFTMQIWKKQGTDG